MSGNIISVIRKKDEEILRLNKRVLDETPDLIAVVAKDYTYEYVNPSYSSAHGKKQGTFSGKNVRDFVGEEPFQTIIKPKMDRCFAGEEIRYEEWFDFPRLGVRFMDLRYLPLSNGSGKIDRIVVILRDITSLKQSEVIRLNQEKLKTVVELAGTYNHEINNPLTSIRGYLELIFQAGKDGPAGNYAEKAIEDVERIARVTQKLADATQVSLADYPGGEKIVEVTDNADADSSDKTE